VACTIIICYYTGMKHILYIDDCPTERILLREKLKDCEIEIHTVGDYDGFTISIDKYDLIILDINLSNENGKAIYDDLRPKVKKEVDFIITSGLLYMNNLYLPQDQMVDKSELEQKVLNWIKENV